MALVTDHVLYMIELIECLSKLGFFLHEQLGKNVILNSLPKSYLPFLTHFRITKPIGNYHSLLGLLQNFEKDHQLQKELVNLVGGSSSGHRPFKKGKKNKKKKVHMLGRLNLIRSRSPRPIKVRQNTFIARSGGTGRGIVLSILPLRPEQIK